MVEFVELSQKFKDLIKSIGVQKGEIENIFADGSASSNKKKSILDKFDTAMKKLRKLMAENVITEEERKRRIAELNAEIGKIELLKHFEADFEERMRLNRKLSRLSATLGT